MEMLFLTPERVRSDPRFSKTIQALRRRGLTESDARRVIARGLYVCIICGANGKSQDLTDMMRRIDAVEASSKSRGECEERLLSEYRHLMHQAGLPAETIMDVLRDIALKPRFKAVAPKKVGEIRNRILQ
jgi:hypothetical protein